MITVVPIIIVSIHTIYGESHVSPSHFACMNKFVCINCNKDKHIITNIIIC